MRIMFKASIFLSALVTIGAIAVVQQLTATFHLDRVNPMWSNGNPALFFIVAPMPIIAYFLFSMIFVFEKVHKKYRVNRPRFIRGYSVLFFVLVSYTLYRIVSFHETAQPYFAHDIGYLNPYSNDLFFNVWTLAAALCISAIVSFYLDGRTKGTTEGRYSK